MSRLRTFACTAALLASGLCVAGSRRDAAARPPAPTAPAPARLEPTRVTIIAREYAYEVPARVPAGLTTLRLENHGRSNLHHAQLFRLSSDRTIDDLRTALRGKWPPPAWMVMLGGPSNVWPGEATEMTVVLTPGTYALACYVPKPAPGGVVPHHALGMLATFTVPGAATERGGGTASRAEPVAELEVTLREYGFDLSTPLAAGRRTVRVENRGAQPHEVMLTKLDPGTTMADLNPWFDHPHGARWPFTVIGGVNGVSPGQHAFFSAELAAGDYVLICLADDVKDGRMHIRHGMMRAVTVR